MFSVSSDEQLQTTDRLPSHPIHPFLTSHPRFGLKSTNVFLPDNFEPTEAIILVENEKIAEVIIPKETNSEILAKIYSDWNIQDYGNLHIFPGLVDCNVHLHTNFNSEWENISYCTEAAAAGGVTTIIDNPIMTKPFTLGSDYVSSLQQRISILKDNCKVDFGVIAALEPRTKGHITEILESGAMGLKCYILNCMQEGVGHFSSEEFPEVIKDLEKHKDLLLMVHPEMATERDLYLTSPCRIASLEKRIDKKYAIKPLEFGGAANRGSYLDELCKKSTYKDEDDDDDDCPSATLDTPSKLKGQVKKTKEKTEIDDIVHFELLSYGYRGPKEEKNEDSSSDSDNDEPTKKKGKANSLPTCAEVAETSSDNQEEDGQENQSYLSNLPLKKSGFSRQSSEIRTLRPLKENSEREEEDQKKDSLVLRDDISPLVIPNEDNPKEKVEEPQVIQIARTESVDEPLPLLVSKTKSLVEEAHPLKIRLRANNSEANKTLNQTRKLLSFLTVCDAKKSLEKTTMSSQPVVAIEGLDKKEPVQDNDNQDIKSAPIATGIIETIPKISSESTESVLENHVKSQVDSPALSSRPMTPASSSLLQRRMSRKSSHGIAISATSTLSSPSSDFTKVNSLDVIKSPGSLAKKEAKYNQSYRIFLANRPQNWEENAVSLILAALKPNTQLRVLLPNLSLASSFLKVRQKKKLHESLVQRIFSDASPAHLFFNEKMVKKGDTKYKVSPPFRNKENRRLLVENFRLGGIDVVSSYHFYVPPRFKNIDDGNFRRAFGGLDTMGCSLQAVWTAAYSHQQKTNKKFSEDLIYQKKIINHILWQMYRSMCCNPSQMLRIGHKKGMIAKGKDADLVIWDPYKVTDCSDRGPNHVFAGRSLLGTVFQTYLRGNLIFDKEDCDQVSKEYRPEFLRPE